MKRYWLSILLVLLIAMGISSYYIQAAANRLPEFVLQRVAGDEQAAAGLSLHATYSNRQLRETVLIDAQGSEYQREQSLLDKLSPYWGIPELDSLIQRYPGFMRGKREIRGFFEDGNQLIYANLESKPSEGQRDFRFHVSVLDKKKGQTYTFESAVPNGESYTSIAVQDVQAVEGQVKIITMNEGRSTPSEPHLYTLARQGAEPVQDQVLPGEPAGSPDVEPLIETIDTTDVTRPSPYIVIFTRQMEKVQAGHAARELTGGSLLVYESQTGQNVKIDSQAVNDALRRDSNGHLHIYLEGDTVYMVTEDDQTVRVVAYHIAENKASEWVVPAKSQNTFIHLEHGRLYLIAGQDVTITELATGKQLYEGTLALKDSSKDSAEALSHLMLDSVIVVD